jgi:outer membrane immunogenic protein
MTMFKSIMSGVALTGAAALLSTSALAEGLPSSGRVASPVYNWTGFYAGLNAGYAWGNGDFGSSLGCSEPLGGCFFPVNSDAQAFIDGQGSKSVNSGGFTGGVQGGYLAQSGRFVFGYEVDFNALDIGSSREGGGAVPGLVLDDPVNVQVRTSFSTDWLLTIRGRLGVTVTPNVLVYATGGLAVADVSVTNSFKELGAAPFTTPGSSSSSDVKTGWTVGGGVEWALGNNWSVKAEYLYVDLGSINTTAAIPFPDGGTTNSLNSSVDITAHIARAGLNYKF